MRERLGRLPRCTINQGSHVVSGNSPSTGNGTDNIPIPTIQQPVELFGMFGADRVACKAVHRTLPRGDLHHIHFNPQLGQGIFEEGRCGTQPQHIPTGKRWYKNPVSTTSCDIERRVDLLQMDDYFFGFSCRVSAAIQRAKTGKEGY